MTPEGLALVKEFEGLRLDAYKDPVGIWTIGYGTTAAAGVGIAPKAGMRITEAEAGRYLEKALTKFWAMIEPGITRKPNEYQADAMLSLAYNIGPGAFKKSTLLRKWNAGDIDGAAEQFLVWNKAGGKVLTGLKRRREAERALFLKAAKPSAWPGGGVMTDKPAAKPVAVPSESWLVALLRAIARMFGGK
jgi:lysozyme